MSLALAQTQTVGVGEGTGTDTAMGTFSASLSGVVAANADVTGTLNCGEGTFSGSLVNGVYGLPNGDAAPISSGGANNTFMGPLVSDYNGTTAEFVDGRFVMTVPTLGECFGTWSASYSGPLVGGGSVGGPADSGAD